MTASKHVIEVSESDFQYEVLAYSNQTPVVVDFWAEWCAPCKMLSPILEKLAEEGQGSFRLAKVDVDANPRLTVQYGIQGIPAVAAFRNGQIVAEFKGALPEAQVREFLRKLTPSSGNLAVGKATNLLNRGRWDAAAETFHQVLDREPENAAARLGLAKSYLAQGNSDNALTLLRDFPASKEYSIAEQLISLAEAMRDNESITADEDDDLATAYRHALRLVGRGNIPSALDGLLDVLRADKNYGKGQAHKLAVALLHLLGEENPLSKEYRSELSGLVF